MELHAQNSLQKLQLQLDEGASDGRQGIISRPVLPGV
jgi:hypothetical protein